MVKKIITILLVILGLAVSGFADTNEKDIRIAIIQDGPSLYIRVKGHFEIYDLNTNKLVYSGKSLRYQLVGGYPDKINFIEIKTNLKRVKLAPKRGSRIYINKRLFKGSINLIRKDNNKILVINELGLEDYVRGVLTHEVAFWWPMDALKAQAVIARSYALYQKQFTKNKDFDLTADIYSQVYGGASSERWRANRAVDLTRSQVLKFNGSLFPTYYHATCSGHTEDANMLWKIDILPLKGVVCNFCADSPHFSWQASMPLEEIKTKLMQNNFNIGEITEIRILGRNNSGRITELEIKDRDKPVVISAKDFRQIIGPNVIRSTNFNVRTDSDIAYFGGLGWGHGVGLCQWGVYFMAKEGYKYDEILNFYFPGSSLSSS